MYTKCLLENLEGGDCLGHLHVDVRVMLKWSYRNKVWGGGLDSTGPMADSCECSNEFSDSV